MANLVFVSVIFLLLEQHQYNNQLAGKHNNKKNKTTKTTQISNTAITVIIIVIVISSVVVVVVIVILVIVVIVEASHYSFTGAVCVYFDPLGQSTNYGSCFDPTA